MHRIEDDTIKVMTYLKPDPYFAYIDEYIVNEYKLYIQAKVKLTIMSVLLD